MNSLKGRVLIVLRGAGQPLSARQIARILGLPVPIVTSPVSKLCSYGQAEYELRGKERVYRAKQEATA